MIDDLASAVPIDHPGLWEMAGHILDSGGCVVMPTDTVYGIGVHATNADAVARLQQAKGRSDHFPPPVLVADPEEAWALVSRVPVEARRLADAFWPGPLTLVLPTDRADLALAGATGTIGVRVPDQDGLRDLLRTTGPLAVSSANKHDCPPATTAQEAVEQLGDLVELYIDGGATPGPAPSTVVDCASEPVRVLREGLLPTELIMSIAGAVDA
ncbi:MAG: L-threonylcarbamoyladenylate synthase [Propionibacteriaceae bacterium]|nr:L-threonylcarbamoyladenylate synthase [Propionibacteriaceae bacterium]